MGSSDRSPPVARARRIGNAFDLLGAYDPIGGVVFQRAGLGVAGSGVAATIALSEDTDGGSPGQASAVLRGLRAITLDVHGDGEGAMPRAVGALPFDAPVTGELVVPQRAVVRALPDATWSVDMGPEEQKLPPAVGAIARGRPSASFGAVQVKPVPAPDVYAAAVREALKQIAGGGLEKVVLARTIEVSPGRLLDVQRLAHRLRAVDPDAYTFVVPRNHGVLVGATPELLVSRRGREVRSNPLAGSAPRSGDAEEDRANADALARSPKNHAEHSVVVQAVAETLGPFCAKLEWDPAPVVVATANVWHLSTRFRGLLREPSPSVLELVFALHPTPAVAGAPLDAALRAIASLEPFERGAYAGPVGWMDATGDGEWAVALRCAEVRGDRATLFAGAGIVAGSDPAQEVEETERKFGAFLDALRWS